MIHKPNNNLKKNKLDYGFFSYLFPLLPSCNGISNNGNWGIIKLFLGNSPYYYFVLFSFFLLLGKKHVIQVFHNIIIYLKCSFLYLLNKNYFFTKRPSVLNTCMLCFELCYILTLVISDSQPCPAYVEYKPMMHEFGCRSLVLGVDICLGV